MIILADDGYLNFKKGDLVQLDHNTTGDYVLTNNWARGENIRSGERGDFASEHVYVLPTLSKPSNEILVLV